MEWYGRGPHECYPDRTYGAPLRRYSVPDAAQLHTPYIFPGQKTPAPLQSPDICDILALVPPRSHY